MKRRHLTTTDSASADPDGHRGALVAYVRANPPPPGRSRSIWYLYDIEFDGELLVSNSRDPECELARALLARGITGKLTLVDAITRKPRLILDIEKMAKLTVEEGRSRGPRLVKWKPGVFVGWITARKEVA
jgi:hypothetical protein